MTKKLSRRDVLKASVGSLAGLVTVGTLLDNAQADCKASPQQTEGPFYPTKTQPDRDNDLTLVKGSSKKARGDVIYIFGQVQDENCKSLDKAIVEIWQACASGKYNHQADPSPAPLDPHFQYWGRCATDKNGHYCFKTIIPGSYKASSSWKRPPHIHFKVFRRGYYDLTSQLYFAGNALNTTDHILQGLSAKERSRVIVHLKAPDKHFDYSKIGDFKTLESTAQVGHFNIVIKEVTPIGTRKNHSDEK